jgi:hypothetical protein
LPAADQAPLDQEAEGLAHRVAAGRELLAQLGFGRKERQYRIRSAGYPVLQRPGDVNVQRLAQPTSVAGRRTLCRPSGHHDRTWSGLVAPAAMIDFRPTGIRFRQLPQGS